MKVLSSDPRVHMVRWATSMHALIKQSIGFHIQKKKEQLHRFEKS